MLKQKNDWLQSQLEHSKTISPDTLVEKLQNRIEIQQGELERLSKDSNKNMAAIREKEEEIAKSKKTLADLENDIEKEKQRYEELFFQLDLCPYCESDIVELTNVDEDGYGGKYKAYACGHAELGGEIFSLCPYDYPEFNEFDFQMTYNEPNSLWIGKAIPKTERAKKISFEPEVGSTKEEVEKLFREAYTKRRSRNPNWKPNF